MYREPAEQTEPLSPLVIEPEPLWRLRRWQPGEAVEFIRQTWSDSYHDGSRDVRALRFADYRDRMHARIQRVLARSECWLATMPEDPTHLYGYVVGEGRTLHYVYVRPARRGYGLARALLAAWTSEHAVAEASHDTKHGARITRALNLTYNPLAIEGP